MNRYKSKIKDSWPDKLPDPSPFPFEEEYPENHGLRTGKNFIPNEYVIRCAGVILIFTMVTILGQIWGNPRFSTVQQLWDIPTIQESIPLIGDYLLTLR
jgi:hypothetical protein